jgi:hypothetical protein
MRRKHVVTEVSKLTVYAAGGIFKELQAVA